MAAWAVSNLSDGDRLVRRAALVALAVVVGKSVVEIFTGDVLFSGFHLGSVGRPVAACHAGGTLGGLLGAGWRGGGETMKIRLSAPIRTLLATFAVGVTVLAAGCASPAHTAQAGAWLGRGLGAPLGFTATALDEAIQYAGDVVDANPRYQGKERAAKAHACPGPRVSTCPPASPRTVRSRVVIETYGATEAVVRNPRETEACRIFWAEK
jgi:hypothetical protein